MPKRKSKYFYIDTNIALDYATNRNRESVIVLEKIKEKKWDLVSSSFLSMELADYKKTSIFISKALDKKWEPRKIVGEMNNNKKGKGLRQSDFDDVSDWIGDFKKNIKRITMYDFLQDNVSWEFAQKVSLNSELSAPDSIHLASAIVGSYSNKCDFFITADELLIKEGKKIIKDLDIEDRIEIVTIAEVKKKFFSK